jgi:hypothetical protein
MRGSHWRACWVLAAMAATGCQSGPSKKSLASAEPALSPPVEGGTAVVQTPPAQGLTFVERHPLLYKPRDYYESSGNNAIVKSAAAVVVGVPAGIVGELRQIVIGTPPEPRY